MTPEISVALPSPIKLEPNGPREVVDTEKAEKIISHWTNQLLDQRVKVQTALGDNGADLTNIVLCDRIRLSDKSYTAEGALVIATFLRDPFQGGLPIARGIAEADLSDIIASLKTEEGFQVLETICDAFADSELIDVNLSDNAFGPKGIAACKTVLNMQSLKRLAVCNNGLDENSMTFVVDILTMPRDELGTSCIAENMNKIHFFNNMSGVEGCKQFSRILENSRALVDIRFSSTRALSLGSNILASALDTTLSNGRNPNLTKLDLCDNVFNNKASKESLFRALGNLSCLTYLDLNDCDLEDDGVKMVCHALFESDSELKHLNLGGNGLTHRGAKHIADYVRDCQGLRVLCLNENEITSKGVMLIAAAFHGGDDGPSIEEIHLNSNMIGSIGARALIDAFGPHGSDLPNLSKICLNGNSFVENVMTELEEAFQDKLGEMDDNDSENDADDDLSSSEDDDDEGYDNANNSGIDALADALEKSLIV